VFLALWDKHGIPSPGENATRHLLRVLLHWARTEISWITGVEIHRALQIGRTVMFS
jgi:serine acetyltransferase